MLPRFTLILKIFNIQGGYPSYNSQSIQQPHKLPLHKSNQYYQVSAVLIETKSYMEANLIEISEIFISIGIN